MSAFLRTRYQFQDGSGAPLSLLTFYWDGTGATDTAMVTEAHARVRAAYAALASFIVGGANLAFTIPAGDFVEETNGQIQSQAVGSLPSAVTFTGTGDILPRATQALVKFNTSTFIRGRRLVGRSFIPGFTESSNGSLAAPSPALITALGAFNTALGTTVVTPMSQRVWNRPVKDPVSGVVTRASLSAIVTSRSVSPSWATLRSRRT